MNKNPGLGSTTELARDVERHPSDSNATKAAADLQLLLEETARAHGYATYTDMERHLAEEGAQLEMEERGEILRRLSRVKHDADEVRERPALPPVDATGLVAISEIARSVARMIRVLLLGYTADEVEELSARMKAERAIEMKSAAGHRGLEIDHQLVLDRLDEAAEQPRSRMSL